jgi:SRSO17 transposase
VYSTTQRRQVDGLQVVVVVWGSLDGRWRIPIAFRLWRPKKRCAKPAYHTKPQLAQIMLREVLASGLRVEYVTFDTHYTSRAITKMLTRLGVSWVGSLQDKTIVVWRGRRQSLAEVMARVRLKWRKGVQVRATILTLYTPNYGHLRVVVAKNSRGTLFTVASHDLTADLATLVRRKRSRWSVETVFRDTKQFVGLQACQSWVDAAMVRHVALVLLTCVVLQRLRCRPDECVGQVKLRWQVQVIRQGDRPPPPLTAAPAHLRSTA